MRPKVPFLAKKRLEDNLEQQCPTKNLMQKSFLLVFFSLHFLFLPP